MIVIYRVKITPMIPHDNRQLRVDLLKGIKPQLTQWISNPVISGMTIYSTEATPDIERSFQSGNYTLNIKQVKTFDLKGNPVLLLHFLNNALRNVMSRLNYMEIGRTTKFFDTSNGTKFDGLLMFPGYKASFARLEGGVYLRVDSAKKIVNNKTVLEIIDGIYKKYQSEDKEKKREIIKEELIGNVIMTNYGKPKYYRIEDIDFRPAEEITIDGKGTLIQYFKDKYNANINKPKQPLLKV